VEDQPPVVDVERCRDRVAPHGGQLGRLGQRHPGQDRHQHREQRGQKAARSPQPEIAEADPPAAIPLVDQQVGDEIAAEGEEDADPQHASRSPGQLEVVGDDGQDGDRPQSVQAGHVALAVSDRLRHAWLPPTNAAARRSAPSHRAGAHG
jgi:hypothetical protein